MKIAILGGSFDPPHLGHFLIALQVFEQLNMDEIWFMPVYNHPFHRELTDSAIRMEMIKKLETVHFKASNFEMLHNKSSYTIDTLTQLKAQYPNDTFYWITGSDQLEHFHKYKDWQQIIKHHNLIIFPREWMLNHIEDKVKELLRLRSIPKNVIVLNTKSLVLTNISSTRIRERIKNKLSVEYFLPKGIETIIKKYKLYE